LDRQIVYPQSLPQDTDILSTNKNALVGLGLIALDIFGPGTVVGGLPCAPTAPASLGVLMGPGRIYSLQNIDGTAYGSLPADVTDQILKQGIQLGNVTLATPAPATAGFSVNYLIEAAYQDADTNAVVLPFFNSNNPQGPSFQGQNNNGLSLPTKRQGLLVVQAKAGVPATTGTQVTPAPDAGFVGLYVVTVANGQATVTSANVFQIQGAPFLPSNLGSPLVSHLPAEMDITSNTVLANTGLGLTLPVGTYAIEALLNFNGPVTGTQGLKLSLTNGTAVMGNNFGLGIILGSVNGVGQNTFFSGNLVFPTVSVATTVDYLLIKFAITVVGAGTLILQAAQNTSSANATRILSPSYLIATKV
jgi:hypothetical protein